MELSDPDQTSRLSFSSLSKLSPVFFCPFQKYFLFKISISYFDEQLLIFIFAGWPLELFRRPEPKHEESVPEYWLCKWRDGLSTHITWTKEADKPWKWNLFTGSCLSHFVDPSNIFGINPRHVSPAGKVLSQFFIKSVITIPCPVPQPKDCIQIGIAKNTSLLLTSSSKECYQLPYMPLLNSLCRTPGIPFRSTLYLEHPAFELARAGGWAVVIKGKFFHVS